MKTKEDRFTFSKHSLQRGLQRCFLALEPYVQKQYDGIKEHIIKHMTWNSFNCEWELIDYNLRLVIVGNVVVTISSRGGKTNPKLHGIKPITQHQKDHPKKTIKLRSGRNAKSKYNSKGY